MFVPHFALVDREFRGGVEMFGSILIYLLYEKNKIEFK